MFIINILPIISNIDHYNYIQQTRGKYNAILIFNTKLMMNYDDIQSIVCIILINYLIAAHTNPM